MLVTFEDVSYSVAAAKKGDADISILEGVSGYFQGGELAALMGPSGCGKTTLLDVLAGRKTVGAIGGEVLYGGAKAKTEALRSRVGYVEQRDTLCGILSVREMLMYTAELKGRPEQTHADREALVATVLRQLRLDECAETVIGSEMVRGVSGGQAKRVNVGLALVTSPDVLYLDEPTTGLDSTMANEVVLVLRDLARSAKIAVCATIHSPTGFAFGLFDRLMLLKGGRTAYFGALNDHGAALRGFFEAQGFEYPTQMTSYSLCEWVIDIINDGGIELTTKIAHEVDADGEAGGDGKGKALRRGSSAAGAVSLHDAYVKSGECQAAEAQLTSLVESAREKTRHASRAESGRMTMTDARGRSGLSALFTLLRWRTSKAMPTPDFLGPRFGDKILFSIVILTLYWGVGGEYDPQSVQSTVAVLFMFVALNGYGAAAYVPTLVLERPLYYRERNDGCYGPLTYLVWKVLEEGLMSLITSTVFCCATFWAVDLQGSFGLFWITYYLSAMSGIILAYLFASACPNLEVANAALPTYVTIQLFFGGLFITDGNVPPGWKWAMSIDFLRYPFQSFMLNQFRDIDPLFSADGFSVLEFYGMDDKHLDRQVSVMCVVRAARGAGGSHVYFDELTVCCPNLCPLVRVDHHLPRHLLRLGILGHPLHKSSIPLNNK